MLYPTVRFKIIYEFQYIELLKKYKGADSLDFQEAIAS